ncbi:MAG: LysM peptidoglycan-binding domain-containing protein [Chloroflexota bacterium]
MRQCKRHILQRQRTLRAALLLLLLVLWERPFPTWAQEPLPTATPDEAGVIYVEVQPNDSLWNIAAQAGLTLNQLLELNGLSENAFIQPGQRLIVGYGPPPATATAEPLPTATLPPPTPHPTQPSPRTAICLLAYHDQNRDGVHDATETLRPAVAFTIFNETAVVANYITDGLSEPYCVEGLSKGQYHITRSIGPNEVLTNDGNWAIRLRQGDVALLEFGSYLVSPGGEALPTATTQAVNAPTQAATAQPTPQPASSTSNTPRNATVFLLIGLVVMTIFVAVIFLLIHRQLKK